MEKSTTMLLLTEAPEGITFDGVSQISKSITEYGIMAVCCAIFLIMVLVMFNIIIKRFVKQDEITTNSILDTVKMLKDVKNNNVNIAGSFDKHNMVATQEFKNIEAELADLTEVINEFDTGFSELKTELHAIQDNQSDIHRKIESLNYSIDKLSKITDRLSDNVDRIR